MTTNELIDIVSKITKENIEYVNKKVTKLSANQLEWRPNSGVWNIQEVLVHLNSYANYYHPAFLKRIENFKATATKFQVIKDNYMEKVAGEEDISM